MDRIENEPQSIAVKTSDGNVFNFKCTGWQVSDSGELTVFLNKKPVAFFKSDWSYLICDAG